MVNELLDIKARVAELTSQRDRTDKKSLTTEQRIKKLNKIYDGALAWLEQCVIMASAKGSGAATMILERARLEIEMLEKDHNNTGVDQIFEIRFANPEIIKDECPN